MKVHLRRLSLAGHSYHVVTLRPATDVFFSTNFYHNTWHIVSDQRGSRLLARLLWGLSYQRHPGTLVLLHGRHLRPTPFDGAPSGPVLLLPAGLTPRNDDAFRQLKARLRNLGPPDQTIRWQTFGLDVALREEEARPSPGGRGELYHAENEALWQAEQMGRRGGFICYTAPPAILRERAREVHGMRVQNGAHFWNTAYCDLARPPRGWGADGEVQIFADYRQRLSAAVQARNEVLARPDRPRHPEALEEVISQRRDTIQRGRKRS